MIGEAEKAHLRAAVAALNGGNVAGYVDNFDPACKRWIAGLDQPLSLDHIVAGFEALSTAFEGMHTHEESMFSDGRYVCARWRVTGRHVKTYMGVEPSGVEISVRNCEIYEFDGAKVVEVWTYGDPTDLLRQINTAA